MSLVRPATLLVALLGTLLGASVDARSVELQESGTAGFTHWLQPGSVVAETPTSADADPSQESLVSASFSVPLPKAVLLREATAIRRELPCAVYAADQVRGPPVAA